MKATIFCFFSLIGGGKMFHKLPVEIKYYGYSNKFLEENQDHSMILL